MRPEVFRWVEGVVAHEKPRAPVLEVGALDVNGSIRPLFPEPYVGLDLQPGPGVDEVGDIEECDGRWAKEGFYKTVVCCETLEHVNSPADALAGMWAVAAEDSLLIVTTVFAFPVHEFPADYWRFTPNGLQKLMEDAGFVVVRVDTEGDVPGVGPIGVFGVGRKP
jgi:hypothetical protein